MLRTLLIVDDDDNVRDTITRLFRRKSDQLLTASNAQEALAIMRVQADQGVPVSVVLSDYMMPGLNGIDFLSIVQDEYPDTTRILLTGHTDTDMLIDGINKGLIHKFLSKPWNSTQLEQIVTEAFERNKLIMENQRLSNELTLANKKLQEMNIHLEAKVKEKAEQLAKHVYYDELTGLASRTLVADRVNQAIHRAARDDSKVAVFVVGLNRFKIINDSLGYQVGDEILKQIALRLKGAVRLSDTVSRIGSDMFCVLICGHNNAQSPSIIIQRLFDTISEPLVASGQRVFLTAALGIALYPQDGTEFDTLFSHAETAMGEAKKNQKANGFSYYSGEFNQVAGQRLSIESELRHAIEQRQFVLHYQPRIHLEKKCIVGVEALLRWQHPSRGLLPPGEFLDVLEETDLIQPVGNWILEEGCAVLKRLQSATAFPIKLAINLSAKQFRDLSLPENLTEIANREGLDLSKHHLEVEITESLMMENVERAIEMLRRLHGMGLLIAVDDFGTGYSSLSYLIQFPLHYLKIDKSFVDNIHRSNDAKAVVEAIISLSYSLNLNVIAEGVETRAQLSALQALGCKQFQGYLFAKPMTEDKLVELLKKDGGASVATLPPEDRALEDTISTIQTRKFY